MVSDTSAKDAKRGWQRTQENVGLLWRNRYGRLLLLCPCLFVFLTLLWSPSVSSPPLCSQDVVILQQRRDTLKGIHL